MENSKVLYEVYKLILDRKENPKEGSYTNYLFDKGIDKMLKKVGEETTETIIAAKNTNKNELVYEISDLIKLTTHTRDFSRELVVQIVSV